MLNSSDQREWINLIFLSKIINSTLILNLSTQVPHTDPTLPNKVEILTKNLSNLILFILKGINLTPVQLMVKIFKKSK